MVSSSIYVFQRFSNVWVLIKSNALLDCTLISDLCVSHANTAVTKTNAGVWVNGASTWLENCHVRQERVWYVALYIKLRILTTISFLNKQLPLKKYKRTLHCHAMLKMLYSLVAINFQQDGSTPHSSVDVQSYLYSKVPWDLFCREDTVARPPRSPGLTILESFNGAMRRMLYFLWAKYFNLKWRKWLSKR